MKTPSWERREQGPAPPCLAPARPCMSPPSLPGGRLGASAGTRHTAWDGMGKGPADGGSRSAAHPKMWGCGGRDVLRQARCVWDPSGICAGQRLDAPYPHRVLAIGVTPCLQLPLQLVVTQM